MADTVIKVEHLSKTFKLPKDKSRSLKGSLVNILKRRRGYELQHVLRGIDFEVERGEFFGIVGKNGGGKSTLLKLLAGIYTPNAGNITVNGSLTPFIELGVGFNPDLTGRENIYLNGALLGFSRSETNAMYQEIVDFAELERFMDQKLRNYSSGMQVRLAFSIAIKSNSDILLFDEVLAVGDTDFQVKCFNYFKKIKEDKSKTVVLVTHDMAAVQKFCTRALVLSKGKIVTIGDPSEVAVVYQALNFPDKSNKLGAASEKLRLTISKKDTVKNNTYDFGQKLNIDIVWDKELVGVENVGIAIVAQEGNYVFGTNTIVDKVALKPGTRSMSYGVELNLGGGTYVIKGAVFGESDDDTIYFNDTGLTIYVKDSKGWGGVTKLPHNWSSGGN